MNSIELLGLHAEHAYEALLESLNDVPEEQAWAVAGLDGPDYLHSNGSILGIVQHIASCKVMYASAGFRNLEVRWRLCADRIEALGSDWHANLAYLEESQDYWMSSWHDLQEADLPALRQTNWGVEWPAWRIIATMTHHDSYHAGQIALLRASLKPSATPPESTANHIREYLRDSPSW